MQDGRIQIGVLVCHLSSHYAQQLCLGIQQAAAQAGASVFFFPGSTSDDIDIPQEDRSDVLSCAIYQYAAHCRPDVLILSLGSIAAAFADINISRFLQQFAGIPCIILENTVPGYRCITNNNVEGFSRLVEHLIVDHHYTRIGYVDGRTDNPDAIERKTIFAATLGRYGIPFVPERIVCGGFTQNCEAEVGALLDANPDLEAIVCANDDMALGAFRELSRRGLQIGSDIALTGFDDSGVAENIHPRLTTVHSDTLSMGICAVEEALRQLNGLPQQTMHIQSRFVRRSSCGCLQSEEMFFSEGPMAYDAANYQRIARQIFTAAVQGCPAPEAKNLILDCLVEIIDMLCGYVDPATPDTLPLATLLDAASRLTSPELVGYLSLDRLQMLFNLYSDRLLEISSRPALKPTLLEAFARVNRLLSGCKCDRLSLINQSLRRSEWISSHIVSDALHLKSRADIYREICGKVRQLGASSCYLYLFEKPVQTADAAVGQKALLAAWCDATGCHLPEGEAPLLRPDQLFHNDALPQNRPLQAMVFNLFTGTEQHGLLLCECGLEAYQSLYLASLQTAAALKYMRLMDQQQEMLQTISDKNEMLQMLSTQDELTHILNRRGFLEQIQRVIQSNPGREAVLFYMDLDHLKTINDRFGHSSGDFALRAMADTIRPTLARGDVFGRMGGDEFTVLRLMPPEEIDAYVQTVRQAFVALNLRNEKPFLITTSIGSRAFTCAPGVNLHSLLSDADEQLYQDKQSRVRNVLR